MATDATLDVVKVKVKLGPRRERAQVVARLRDGRVQVIGVFDFSSAQHQACGSKFFGYIDRKRINHGRTIRESARGANRTNHDLARCGETRTCLAASVDIARRTAESKQVSILAFLLRRLGLGLVSIVGVSTLVFLFLHMVPGDPVDHLAGGDATPEQRAAIAKCMGLDRSLPAQYFAFWQNVADGSLGHQCPDPKGKPTVRARLMEVMPSTVGLACAGMVVALLLALPLGIWAAVRRGTWVDTLASALALIGLAMPMMLMAPLLLVWFFVELGWLPGPTEGGFAAVILPAVAIGVHLMAMLARMTRASMIDVLDEDYIRTARAKGLTERAVLWRHALRNAMLPVITVAGLQFGALLTGAIVVEKVFARPGLGTTLLTAISERNYPVVQGAVLFIALLYVIVNTSVDLAYGLIDPRIRRG